jgi:hypothetical protein
MQRETTGAYREVERRSDEPSDYEHFPWHYTEFGVVCACGRPMRDEVCPADTSHENGD